MKRLFAIFTLLTLLLSITACGPRPDETQTASEPDSPSGGGAETTGEATENPGGFDLETATVTLNSGYEMPIMGLGTYSLTDEECYNSVTLCWKRAGG